MQPNIPKTLPPELLRELSARGETRLFARNEQVITEGAVSDSLYVLVSGELKVYTQDERGRELVYNVLQAGELFGELFLDGEARSASVRAISEAHCVVVDQALAEGLIRSFPAFAEFLILSLIARLRHATELCRHLALSDVFSRTVAILDQSAIVSDGVRMIPSSLTQQEIADRVGATREMINHVIGDLIRGGLLIRDDKRRLLVVGPLPCRW